MYVYIVESFFNHRNIETIYFAKANDALWIHLKEARCRHKSKNVLKLSNRIGETT